MAIVELGGGRKKSSDKINPSVGLSRLKRVGDKIESGEPLALIHAESTSAAEIVAKRIAGAYKISDQAVPESLVWRII
jgi:thymidine phosphorylase